MKFRIMFRTNEWLKERSSYKKEKREDFEITQINANSGHWRGTKRQGGDQIIYLILPEDERRDLGICFLEFYIILNDLYLFVNGISDSH